MRTVRPMMSRTTSRPVTTARMTLNGAMATTAKSAMARPASPFGPQVPPHSKPAQAHVIAKDVRMNASLPTTSFTAGDGVGSARVIVTESVRRPARTCLSSGGHSRQEAQT